MVNYSIECIFTPATLFIMGGWNGTAELTEVEALNLSGSGGCPVLGNLPLPMVRGQAATTSGGHPVLCGGQGK